MEDDDDWGTFGPPMSIGEGVGQMCVCTEVDGYLITIRNDHDYLLYNILRTLESIKSKLSAEAKEA